MNDDDKMLTGNRLPSLELGDPRDSPNGTAGVRQALDKLRSKPENAARLDGAARSIDDYVTHKARRVADLRRALGLTQSQLAATLGVSQPEVSRFEGRETWLLDTLTRFVTATGGRLRIIAEYDDAVIELEAPEADQLDLL